MMVVGKADPLMFVAQVFSQQQLSVLEATVRSQILSKNASIEFIRHSFASKHQEIVEVSRNVKLIGTNPL